MTITRTCIVCGRQWMAWSKKARYCSKECRGSDSRGPRNPNWKGGRCIRKDGRALVYAPGHPGATSGSQHILEYRLVAEQKLGRLLRPDEIVHHVNGDPTDNRPENLEVVTQAQHAREHAPERRDPRTGRFRPQGESR